jgi:hypothetical protein
MTLLTSLAPFAQGLGRPFPKFTDQAQPQHCAHHHRFRHDAQDAARRSRPVAESDTAGSEIAARRFLPQAAVDFGTAAQKTVGKALRALGRDLGGLLTDMGFDREAVRGIVNGLIDPVRAALRNGDDFTAEISLVALRQDTLVTDGAYAQTTQIVAKSLEIEVNHTTGAFSVDLQSLSLEQSSVAVGAGISLETIPQGLDLGDAGLSDFIQRLFGGDAPDEAGKVAEPQIEQPAKDAALLGQLDDAADSEAPAPLATDGDGRQEKALPRRGPAPATRFAIRSVERFENFAGQLITRLRLDAALPLDEAAQGTPDEAQTDQSALLDLQV